MSGPADASLNGDGFRFYTWEPEDGGDPVNVISVTSIRKLCGEPFNLVNWQLANIADAALGTMKRTVVGPRGGVSERRQVWEYPCEFAQKYGETGGEQGKIDDLRRWLRDQADSPRNIAAIRGTIVHEAIEKNISWEMVERPYVEAAYGNMSARDRQKIKGITDEDVDFVKNALRQYSDMRASVPFVLIAREPQIFNLTHGYAGSADGIGWFLPEGVSPSDVPAPGQIHLRDVLEVGGDLAVIDWKTSADVHTEHVVQTHAYGAGEFVGANGRVDTRLTDLLQATTKGGLFHIRPNKWAVHLFDFSEAVFRAFFGSVAFARFLAANKGPSDLFTVTYEGSSEVY